MFDPDTAALIQSAPDLPGQPAARLPIRLTGAYAQLVAARLNRGVDQTEPKAELAEIADTYELISVLSETADQRRAAAFVAGTANQLLSKGVSIAGAEALLTRDQVHPSISASLLFLAAEQYPDANEAASALPARVEGEHLQISLLAESLRALAKGDLEDVLTRAGRRADLKRSRVEGDATTVLYGALLDGVELLSAELLGRRHPASDSIGFDRSGEAFGKVVDLSSYVQDFPLAEGQLVTTYPGPRHLALLLRAAGETLASASIQRLKPPNGTDANFWSRWLNHRAKSKPLMWPNHRTALEARFHETGISALMTLPTGAGKTTVAEFKIAGVLGRGKSVIFLVPTHALADQLRDDLEEAFPSDVIGGSVSTDFDLLLSDFLPLARIEVMTPEMCLARLTMAPDAFDDVGMLVFDECHMLSPQAGSVRRAIDGMLCILGFQKQVPDADLLFLSAMVKEGENFTKWIGAITGRDCLLVDPIWKPSRQARGVLLYDRLSLRDIRGAADRARLKAGTQGVGKATAAELHARPFALFGLQHNWNIGANTDIALAELLDHDVQLAGKVGDDGRVFVTSNTGVVSSAVAAAAAANGLKTIVFVNTAQQTLTNAERIAKQLSSIETKTDFERELWTAIQDEMGEGGTSLVPGWSPALPHSADLLPAERRFVETMYRRGDGASVIVATTTLSQGMNLPAEFAIIAGDKRAKLGGRESLKAHELLNAAGRAGRAGHLANGVVLLVPEALLAFVNGQPEVSARSKLKSILPESDRCIELDDPITFVLDNMQEATELAEVDYLINRLHGYEGGVSRARDVGLRSLGAFLAKQKNAEADFADKLANLEAEIAASEIETFEPFVLDAAARSGLRPSILQALMARLRATPEFPIDVAAWITWTTDWFQAEPESMDILGNSRSALRQTLGLASDGQVPGELPRLRDALIAWTDGTPLAQIEIVLGGELAKKSHCPRAREIATEIAPRGFSFAVGLIAQAASIVSAERGQDSDEVATLAFLATAVRRGVNSQQLVTFAAERKGLHTRRLIHRKFAESNTFSPIV